MITLIAQEGSPAGTERLLQFGVLGVVVILFITGWLVTGTTYKRLEAKHEALQELFTERVIPTLERVARVLEQNNEIVVQLVKEGRVRIDPPTVQPEKEGP